MELRQLEYFAAVARHRHFTRAAETLYVSQPALSQQVRRLEAELGVALLVRSPQGVEVTPAGADLLVRAEAILAEAARARAEMNAHAGAERGFVRVAATAADTPALALADALIAFHRAHPGIRIALRHASPRDVAELVASGVADLGVGGLDGGEPLRDEPLVVALPPGDPLAGGGVAPPAEDSGADVPPPPAVGSSGAVPPPPAERSSGGVSLWDLRDRPFILAERGTALRETVMAACEEAGFGPVPPFEVSDPATVRALVSAGLGVGVVPPSWLRGPGPQVDVARLAEPAPRHRVALLAAAGLTPAADLLCEWLRPALR